MAKDALTRMRTICLTLPETTERVSHGEPTWFVRGKAVFVTMSSGHHGPFGFWCAAPPGEQEAAIATAPDRFFRPSYVGGRGWLGVRLDVPADWVEVGEIVSESYRIVAPKRLVAAWDAAGDAGA